MEQNKPGGQRWDSGRRYLFRGCKYALTPRHHMHCTTASAPALYNAPRHVPSFCRQDRSVCVAHNSVRAHSKCRSAVPTDPRVETDVQLFGGPGVLQCARAVLEVPDDVGGGFTERPVVVALRR